MGLSMTIFKKPVGFITLDGKQRFCKNYFNVISSRIKNRTFVLLNDIMTIFQDKNEEKLWGQKEILDVKMYCMNFYRRKNEADI